MMKRRSFIGYSAALAASASLGVNMSFGLSKTPVILDTDIGDDIDDTWALIMLLKMQNLEPKLIVGDYGNPVYRARLIARLLAEAGRTDVPVGIGMDLPGETNHGDWPGNQSGWLGDYQLSDYAGQVFDDGVQAIIDTILASPEVVTLICIGPAPNIAEALRREPAIAENARIVGMYGSVYMGYVGSPEPAAEWNVRVDPGSLQKVFAAPWQITITPLDTCGLVYLSRENYRRIYASEDSLMQHLIANYKVWLPTASYMPPDMDPSRRTSTLFDTVAVHLAQSEEYLEMQELNLRITDDGYTVIDDEKGRPVRCALKWRDMDGFKSNLTDTLLS